LKKHEVLRSHKQIENVEEVLNLMAPSNGKKMTVPRIPEAILLVHIVVRDAMFDTLVEVVDGRGRA
jgi:hypothetical protein